MLTRFLTRHDLRDIKVRSIQRIGRKHECFVTAWANNDHHSAGTFPAADSRRAALGPSGPAAPHHSGEA